MPAVDDNRDSVGSDEPAARSEAADDEARVVGFVDRVDDDAGPLVVALRGEIDISNADTLGAQLGEVIAGARRGLVIDLSGSPSWTARDWRCCCESPGMSSRWSSVGLLRSSAGSSRPRVSTRVLPIEE